jgi:hypothetical protein
MTSPARPQGTAVSPDRLRVQLRPRASALPPDTLVRRYDSNFDVAVVAAHEGGLADLAKDQAAAWDMRADENSKLAVRQTIIEELTELDVRDHTSADGMSTRVIAHDGNPFVNVVLMSLERFTPGAAPHGALVAVPARCCSSWCRSAAPSGRCTTTRATRSARTSTGGWHAATGRCGSNATATSAPRRTCPMHCEKWSLSLADDATGGVATCCT